MQAFPDWISVLEYSDIKFIKDFILSSGSLKSMASKYHITYPTLRLRLNRLIQKIQVNDDPFYDPYVKYIKNLASDNKIDPETAKKLIFEYKMIKK